MFNLKTPDLCIEALSIMKIIFFKSCLSYFSYSISELKKQVYPIPLILDLNN